MPGSKKYKQFDNQKYHRIEIGQEGFEFGIDDRLTPTDLQNPKRKQTAFNFSATDGIANQAEAVISFMHVPSGRDVYFKAFITTFSDTLSPSYNEETVFGRTDPIYTFKNTTRSISLNWKVPAESYSEAYENLGKAQTLAQMVYPNYSNIDNALTLSQTPLVRLKVMNLLSKTGQVASPENPAEGTSDKTKFKGYRSTADSTRGALGVIKSITILHNLENFDAGVLYVGPNTVLPKLIEINISFDVIHEETLGWKSTNYSQTAIGLGYPAANFSDPNFPYNVVPQQEIDVNALNKLSNYNQRIAARQAELRKAELAEQQRENAAARYDTMGGKARFKKDKKRLTRLGRKGSDNLSQRQKDKLDYLTNTMDGQISRAHSIDSDVPEDFIE